ncbi:MAG: hypothetical protein M1398_08485 [Deltaproteobacteria bacterium]|nr:hypothetical protein [Deltaproteobacteria bacterium]
MSFVPDKYDREARILPAILASLPFFILYFFFLNIYIGDFLRLIFRVQFIGDITIGVAFLFLLVLVGRSISKDIFESVWFKSDETRMPSADFLLHTDKEYSSTFKGQIYQKIKNDFQIEILSAEQEQQDEEGARKVIAESVALIRHRLKDGRLLLKRNIEYGFFRNFIGCSVVAEVISLINVAVFSVLAPNTTALILSIIMAVFYALPIALSKKLMHGHGKRYARTLFQEYMGG